VVRVCTFGCATTAAAHRVANNVLQFLRWRNTDENGNVAGGFLGVVFDVAEQNPTPVDYCPWVPAARGQAGYWRPNTEHWFFS
jgi:hypothetical protein